MMSDTEALNLANLPHDIIRKIVRVEPESLIDRVRLISPAWNYLSLEHLSNRKFLPKIISIELTHVFHYEQTVKLVNKYREFFGAAKWGKLVSTNNREAVTLYDTFYKGEEEMMKNRLTHLFNRCSRVEKLALRYHSSGQFNFVNDSLNDVLVVEFSTMVQNFKRERRESLLHFLQLHSVQKLNLDFGCFNLVEWSREQSEGLWSCLVETTVLEVTIRFNDVYNNNMRAAERDWKAGMEELLGEQWAVTRNAIDDGSIRFVVKKRDQFFTAN